jgi:hypothetical protein
MRSACESLVAVLCYTSMYTVRAVPVPAPLRALTAGFQSTRLSFMAEPVFQLREWLSHLDLQVRVCNCVHGAAGFSSMNVCVCVCVTAGVALHGSYWMLLACIATYGLIYFIIVRGKPFSLESQFDARLTQVLALLFVVSSVISCSLR